MMPGPVMTVTVSESARRGAVAGPLLMLGHGLLEALLVLGLLVGLAPLLARDDVFITVSLAGGLILLWMAWTMVRDLPQLRLHVDAGEEKRKNLVIAGIMLSIANPYWLIWWATIGLGYIMYAAQFGIPGIFAFFAGHILADLAWYSLISFGIARGRNLLGDGLYRGLIGTCAVFLVGFAGYFLVSGITRMV